VARVVRGATTAAFRANLTACRVVPGTAAGRALGATIAKLSEAGELPGPGDATTLLADEMRGVATLIHVRRVAEQPLWLWYRLNKMGDVVLIALTDHPP
jgi:hypothetical protein